MRTTTKGATRAKPTNAREYLDALSEPQRAALVALRDAIRAAAPGAEDAFSYGMPALAIDGRPVLWYAAWKAHYSVYPVSAAFVASDPEAARYAASKGTLRLPAREPIPMALVRRLTRARVAELS